jgi:molybdate transport system permease protein
MKVDWDALRLTCRLALCATAALAVIGLPLANWLATTRRRWRTPVEAIVALPLVLPPTVLGLYVLLLLGPHSPLGRGYERLTGHGLPFTFEGLLLASVLYSLPFTVQPFTAALRSVDPALIEASWCLGVSRWATFWRVMVPLAWPGLLAGVVLSFAHTLGEFGVVLMVGGNVPGETRTVSIAIYDAAQALDYASAARTSLALMLSSFLVLCLTYALQPRVRMVWPWARNS